MDQKGYFRPLRAVRLGLAAALAALSSLSADPLGLLLALAPLA